MITRIKQLAGDSLIYGLALILSRFLGIFLIPIYTKLFSPHEYGIIALLTTTYSLLGSLLLLGLDASMMIFIYDFDGENRKRPVAVRVYSQAVATLISWIILLPAGSFIAYKITGETNHTTLFLYSSLNMLFTILPATVIAWFKTQRKAISTMVFTILSSLFTVLLNIYFVVYLKTGLPGIFLSTLISSVIQSIVAFVILKDWLSFKLWDNDLFKKMFAYALPIIPTSFSNWICTSSAAYFLNIYVEKTQVGLYQIALTIASLVFLITGSFQMAWGPFAYSIKDEPDSRKTYAGVFLVYTLLTGLILVCMGAYSKTILRIFTSASFVPAFKTATIIAAGYVVTGYIYIAAIGLNIAKKSWPLATSYFISSIITVLLFFLLIPNYGIEGAGIAVLVGQLVVPVYCFYAAQKVCFIPYNIKKGVFIFFTSVLFAGVCLYMDSKFDYAIYTNSLVVLIYALILYSTNRIHLFQLFDAIKSKLKS